MAGRAAGRAGRVLLAAVFLVLGAGACTPLPGNNEPTPTATGEPNPSATEPVDSGPVPEPTAVPTAVPTRTSPVPTVRPSDTPGESLPPGRRTQEILANCVQGRMAFRPPSPLQQGDTVEFVVRVALPSSPVDPASGLPGTGAPARREPLLCERMRAELTSNRGMKIERSTSDVMSLPEAGVGEWAWHLTATEAGQHEMVLRLLAPDPEGGTITVETFRETITVEVGLGYLVTTWVKEMAQPVQALLGIAAVVGGWLLFVFTRRRRKGKHTGKAPPKG